MAVSFNLKVMEKQFVTHEIALALKELGFDESCLAYYNPTIKQFVGMQNETTLYYSEYGGESHNWNEEKHLISAPLWQQAIDWLREKKRIYVSINSWTDLGYDAFWYEIYRYDSSKVIKPNLPNSDNSYSTFYEAREQAILKAIELCKNK